MFHNLLVFVSTCPAKLIYILRLVKSVMSSMSRIPANDITMTRQSDFVNLYTKFILLPFNNNRFSELYACFVMSFTLHYYKIRQYVGVFTIKINKKRNSVEAIKASEFETIICLFVCLLLDIGLSLLCHIVGRAGILAWLETRIFLSPATLQSWWQSTKRLVTD